MTSTLTTFARTALDVLRTGVGRRFLHPVVGHWPLLPTSVAVFVLVFALLNRAGSGLGLLADDARSTRYELVVFTLRNGGIIPLAVVWMCGIARQLLLAAP